MRKRGRRGRVGKKERGNEKGTGKIIANHLDNDEIKILFLPQVCMCIRA
jgi:hypothetical protein